MDSPTLRLPEMYQEKKEINKQTDAFIYVFWSIH